MTFLFALNLSLPLVLRGAWDLWAQTFLHLSTLVLLGFWLSGKIFFGTLPLPGRTRRFAVLAALLALSAALSPIHGLSYPDFLNILHGLGLFWLASVLSERKRLGAEQALRFTGWLLWALAFYQRFFEGQNPPAGVFPNPNIWAGLLLILIPLSAQWKDWGLCAASFWALTWTGSLSAWLSLSVSLAFLFRKRSPWLFRLGLFLGFVTLIFAVENWQSASVSHRLLWWKAALRMIAERPWTGWGPGAFAYLLPAFKIEKPDGMGSLFAHNMPLEWSVGMGLLWTSLWLWAVLSCLRGSRPHKKLAVLAIFLNNLSDYSLAAPGLFWVFCYLLGCSEPESERIVSPSFKMKPLLLAGTFFLLFLAGGFSYYLWLNEKYVLRAQESFLAGDESKTEVWLGMALQTQPQNPNAYLLLAQLREKQGRIFEAASFQEKAFHLNPYRPQTRKDLERLRSKIKR